MPISSLDFTLASLTIIVVVIGAVFGINVVVAPYLESHSNGERYYQIGQYMLLSKGEPINWGSVSTPTMLGFAGEGGAYNLDIDKITRLNSSNFNPVSYTSLWEALGTDDVSFNIAVKPIFDIVLSEVSSEIQGNDTVYTFSAFTTKHGYPLPCQMSYYITVRNSTYSSSGITDSDGIGTIQFRLPNFHAGTALLICIARTGESLLSYSVLPFAHNITSPHQPRAFASLSPLNYKLRYSLIDGGSVWNSVIFTYNYAFNLTAIGDNFTIPRLLDPSPIVITLTGVNNTDYWAEWTTYPQMPILIGANINDNEVISDLYHSTYIVEINGTFYCFEIKFRSPVEYE